MERPRVLLFAMLASLVPLRVSADAAMPPPAPVVLECLCTYGGEATPVRVRPTTAPYRAPAVDIGTRFRFKAVWVETPEAEARVALYVYRVGKSGPDVLLHEAKYAPPYPSALPGARGGFTGVHFAYEPDASAELSFECAWRPDEPPPP